MIRRERVSLSLDSADFTGSIRRAVAAISSFTRVLDQNANPLDRVNRDDEGPHTWLGDEA